MCLVTDQQEPIKTTRNMTVYKMFQTTEFDNIFSPWSDEHEFKYELNKLHKEKIRFDNNFESYMDDEVRDNYPNFRSRELTHVHNGFHSVKKQKRMDLFNQWEQEIKMKCIIPKGSLIFKDKTGLIVSNQIILKEVLTN